MPMEKRKSCLKTVDGNDSSSNMSVAAAAAAAAKTHEKELCWGDLTIYEFPNMLGDNPGVSEGAPLTIGWKHESKNVVGIEYYEYLRQSRPRRKRKEMMLNSAARDTYLLGLGYKLDQLIEAAEETKRIRKSRQASMKGSPWDKFRAVLEGGFRTKKEGGSTALPKIVAAKSG